MTIKIPAPSVADRLLRMLGKTRGVIVAEPGNRFPSMPYATFRGTREPFLRALLRPAGRPLPEGMIDIFSLNSGTTTKNNPR
ncbi:MAG: hypothetical protein JXR25_13295 [Pontiellaceae bacterium]|nr:hypothetical protein [Candidatus Anaeroferrophillacea bacterium]MBN2785790.1 hypothetical protein [Pontiellaceae bacterium]